MQHKLKRLESPELLLYPYIPDMGTIMMEWYYDRDYQNFFRHLPQVLKYENFQQFESVLGGQIFTIHKKGTSSDDSIMDSVIGCVVIKPDGKTNRACHVGVLLDKKHQQKQYCSQSFIVLLNYVFNDLGYKKAIIEILEKHESLKQIVTKHGFLYEGKLYDECFMDGEWCNELRFCMMNTYFNKHFKPRLQEWSE